MDDKMSFLRKGSVLITVLLVSALLIAVVTVIFEQSEGTYFTVNDVFTENQGAVYAGTVLEGFKDLMAENTNIYDSIYDYIVPPIAVNNGLVSVTIKPVDAMLSFNLLLTGDKLKFERADNAFKELFENEDIDLNIYNKIYDWITPKGTQPRGVDVKGTVFAEGGNRYIAKHERLDSLAEIRIIPEISVYYDNISRFATAGDSELKLNINIASREVITAYLPELSPYIDEIIETREKEPLKSAGALYKITGQQVYEQVLPFFDVRSNLFYIKIEVTTADISKFYHALARRSGSRVSIERYIESTGIDYF